MKNRSMELFGDIIDKTKNRLPKDGTVNYHGKIFNTVEANFYYEKLLDTIEWRNDEAIVFGKRIMTVRTRR